MYRRSSPYSNRYTSKYIENVSPILLRLMAHERVKTKTLI